MSDEMFFSYDERGLIRGRRVASRTDTCRPCILHGPNGQAVEGVILNLTPHGLLVRVMDVLDVGADVAVQLMRDETFREPLAPPRMGSVVRQDAADGAFFDVGIKLNHSEIPKAREPVVRPSRPTEAPRRRPSRMHTLDITIGDRGPGHSRR